MPTIVLTICNLARRLLGRGASATIRAGPGTDGGPSGARASAAFPGLFVAVIIITGILSGVFTATESASIAVLYAILITFVGYRTMTWENFLKASAKA